MADEYVVAVEGISALRQFESLPKEILTAARRAVNYAQKRSRTAAGREMQRQVNFGMQYLTGSNGKLIASPPATDDKLEASIRGRFRATSLARYVRGNPTPFKAGVSVQVSGFAKRMNRAFVIKLRQGSALTETKFNLGLAVRLKDGEQVERKRVMRQIGKGLYLLYGPSIDQVFKDVAADVAPQASDWMEQEFERLIALNNKGVSF